MAAATGFMPPPFDVQILRCQKKRRLFASCCSPRNCKQRILHPALSFASSKLMKFDALLRRQWIPLFRLVRLTKTSDSLIRTEVESEKDPDLLPNKISSSPAAPQETQVLSFEILPLKEINVKVLVRGFNIEDEFFSVDTGIANEEEWGISLLNDSVNESGTNEDGKYLWWEKSDWTGYKELGVESLEGMQKGILGGKHGEKFFIKMNGARIERSAQKQAKSGTEKAGWYENWTDKWAETELGTKWETSGKKSFCWMVKNMGEKSTSGTGTKVHKYGKSTTGESWDIVVDEETYYEADPHYGWADVVGDSNQLLSIQPRERPPGVFPTLDFGSSPPADNDETSSDQE
ncbi:hypothetical protein SASPL_149754 [Salvia splendens]|uniref:Uncharacterized protein n=1 Tax=Salvia splendens TaxID=180675 RepID=A0A8X8W5Z1_SALSN|nr:hypothetical protein SASPL_149754 [Salvia splendens]